MSQIKKTLLVVVNTVIVLLIWCRDPEEHQVSILRYLEIFNVSEMARSLLSRSEKVLSSL